MTSAPTRSPALRIGPAALAQKVAQQLDRHRNGDPHPVLAVRAEPFWPHDPHLTLPDGRRVRVVACVSVLAVWEQLATAPAGEILVLLTDRTDADLGLGVRSRLFRQRVLTVQPWDLVVEAFGAQTPDAGLEAEDWAGEALLDAMPGSGWPKLTSAVLSRDVALRHLAAVRLGLDRLGAGADDLDVALLLRWTDLPGAVAAFALLRPAERDGLTRWLTATLGRPARAVFALLDAGHGTDALPLGLVCDALWNSPDGATGQDVARAQGRVDRYFGDARLDDRTIRAYAEAVVEVVTAMLTTPRDPAVRRQGHGVLDKAEELLTGFDAVGCAGHSPILRTGFTRRVGAAADALRAPHDQAALDRAVDHLAAHQLARVETGRVRRIRMAQRLVRWLATDVEPPASVADGVDRQVNQWGWVDLALNHVWAGEDVHPGLQAAFRDIHQRASRRRTDLDRAFAQRLQVWTGAGPGNDGDLLTVETLLARVVSPLLHGHRPALLVVLDGMSAAVAVELGAELAEHWVEYDPVAGAGNRSGHRAGPARRRGVVAALPTLTAVSRTSLFAGALRSGDQSTEKQLFADGKWGRSARIFHKGPARGGAGEVLAADLARAMADPDVFVAVVINTVDDSLAHGREGDEPGWQVSDLGFLRSLLDLARSAGRAVVVTSDHGHVLERGGAQVRATDAASARHRTGPAPAGDGEVELTGPRVVADNHRIVALWDPALRYRPAKAGYHGGASLAEVTIPLMAFLLPNVADVPPGWVPVEGRQPHWWDASAPTTPAADPAAPQPAAKANRGRRQQPVVTGEALFDLSPDAPTGAAVTATGPATGAATGTAALVDALLSTDLFQAQQELTPRRVPVAKIRAAISALLDANGVLPVAVLAERSGETPARAAGFVNSLQRIFNVDNYPVLSVVDGNRTVRLDRQLLRQQFGLPGWVP